MANLGTIELRILDLDQAKRLFAAAEDRLKKLEAVQEAGKELRAAYAAAFHGISRLPAEAFDRCIELIESEFDAANLGDGHGKQFDDAVAAAVELVIDKK